VLFYVHYDVRFEGKTFAPVAFLSSYFRKRELLITISKHVRKLLLEFFLCACFMLKNPNLYRGIGWVLLL
jgi:hypothetical protein